MPPQARQDGRPLGIVAVQIITCARAPLGQHLPQRDRRTHGHSFSSSSTATTTTSSSSTAAAATPHDADASAASARPKMHAEALPFEGDDLSLAHVEQAANLRSAMGSPNGRIS
jgi:guanyl-specific ribonuclease Sa